MANHKQLVAAVALSGLIGMAHAGEKEELLKLRNTTVNLIKQLVKQGVLTEKMAAEMIKQAESDAAKQVAQETASNKQANVADKGEGGAQEGSSSKALAKGSAKEVVPADEVRVAYVPDFVKDEIRQQVRNELREEVVGDVMQKAKQEQWGMPNALPEWTRKFKLSGDLRLREQSFFMAQSNTAPVVGQTDFVNWQTLNTNGGAGISNGTNGLTGLGSNGVNNYRNTQQNRSLARERFRLNMDVDVAENLDGGIRLASGNTPNPVSTNQSLGNTGAQYQFNLDRAYLRYKFLDESKFNWLTVVAGRTPNPFFTADSEIVWDEDLSFEGAAVTLRHRLKETALSDDIGGKGPTLFATSGVFPMQTNNILTGMTARDKWMFGGQVGLDWGFDNQDSFKLGGAYYDYQGVKAVVNKAGTGFNQCNASTTTAQMLQSAPQFMQGGNSLQTICANDAFNDPGLVGLASDFKILDINAMYEIAAFAPVHVRLSADYAKNLGYNIKRNTTLVTSTNANNMSTAWQFKVDVGWNNLNTFGNWNFFTGYKYVERDAVLDAYTDSDFHNGGTNVKGWMMGGNYALMKNVWITGRWLSGDVISGPRYGMNVMQLDFNSRF